MPCEAWIEKTLSRLAMSIKGRELFGSCIRKVRARTPYTACIHILRNANVCPFVTYRLIQLRRAPQLFPVIKVFVSSAPVVAH